ncbi:MAG: ABC transporter ATP-binding protein [Gammaproteobacteria bacterium]|nr:ABC transporter ATP-binding protein [Gammaproteobacteria bacterium]
MIEIDHLTRYFGDFCAVDDLSFRVQPGEVLGFLGPNGAGKSTTMKMICGFLSPSSGTVRVCGHDVEREPLAAKRRIGYLPEGAPAYGEMSPWQFLSFAAELRGLKGEAKLKALAMAIARLELQEVLHQSIDTLSKGFKRRVGLAQAILHDPDVLILDEPTDGLDPNQKHQVRQLIKGLAADKLVIVSTHILEEVSAVCSRALIIARGRLVADGGPEQLEARSRYHNAVFLQLAREVDVDARLRALPGVAGLEGQGLQRLILARPGHALFDAVSALALKEGWPLLGMSVERGRLDDVFRTLTAEA